MTVPDDKHPRMTPADLRVMAGLPPSADARIPVPEDLRIMVNTLMELLVRHRDAPFFYGAGVRDRFDDFRMALWASGFNFSVTRDRQARAAELRRLGELAEAHGNLAGAIAFYHLAVASWRDVGCRARLQRLEKLSP